MTQNTTPALDPKQDKITVLVFKDNYASRTFQIPLKWISKLSLTLWTLGALCIIASILAAKYYFIAKKSDTSRISDLEQQINDLKSSYQASLAQAQAQIQNQVPTPTVTVTVTPVTTTSAPPSAPPAPPQTTPQNPAAGSNVLLFKALPSAITAPSLDPEAISIRMTNQRSTWQGRNLNVQFDIQYVKNDHKSQQGRIIILARSTGALFSYPANVLNRTEKEALINPNMGEYFSVSRFREVKATVGPLPSSIEPFTEIELLLFSIQGELLIYKKLDTPKFTGVTMKQKPVQTEAPPTSTDPGSDSPKTPTENQEEKTP